MCGASVEYKGRGRPPVTCGASCRAERRARYYAANRDKVAERQARYRAAKRAADPTVPDCRDCGATGASKVSRRCDPCQPDWEGDVLALRRTGLTYEEIGRTYGVSGGYIHQIIRDHAPELTGSRHALRKALAHD